MENRIAAEVKEGYSRATVLKELAALPEVEAVTVSRVIPQMLWVHPAAGYDKDDVHTACNRLPGVLTTGQGSEYHTDAQVDITNQYIGLGPADHRNDNSFARWFCHQDIPRVGNPFQRFGDFPQPNASFTEETLRRGSKIIVAVQDTGVDGTHPEFSDTPSRVVQIYDAHGDGVGVHGTLCASQIAGKNLGLVPEALVLDVKSISAGGSGSFSELVAGMEALIEWVEDPANALTNEDIVILSMSYSAGSGGTSFDSALRALVNAGIVPFTSGGNNGAYISGSGVYPLDNMKFGQVGNCDTAGRRFFGASYGNTIQLWGFGYNQRNAYPGGGYGYPTGSSMSCPLGAGCFATWVSGKYAPLGKLEVEDLVEEWMTSWCWEWPLDPNGVASLDATTYIVRASHEPIVNYQQHRDLSVVLDYGFPDDVQPHDDLRVYILYD